MRRKEKQVVDRAIIGEVLSKSMVGRLGLCLDGMPYVVPVNFAHDGDNIYIHGAGRGKKIDIINENNNVCFEIDEDRGVTINNDACECGYKFMSVIAQGKAYMVEDEKEWTKALNLITEKYIGKTEEDFPVGMKARTTVIKIVCDEIICKQGV